ncbi:MAG: hypothetical protein HZB53_18320 [Chloroflexi bacterium]|nr:hypothetical protein [Chloroflexota bacterium]
MTVALATTHHDPEGRLADQMRRVLPCLRALYAGIAVMVTAATPEHATRVLREAGAVVQISDPATLDGFHYLGRRRREAVALALSAAPGATHAHLCDFDRVLHWAEFHGEELHGVLDRLCGSDFSVLGRTPRAFDSHPRVQRDTEAIINHAFALASGRSWDVGAASRGMSRRAAAMLAACDDDTIGNDCSWPLHLQRHDGLQLDYLATEGLEFETLDRYADQVAALGSREAWIARMDADPRHWATRLELARIEVESAARWALVPPFSGAKP